MREDVALDPEDCVLEMPRGPDPWGRRFEGQEAVRAGLAGRFAGIPDVHYGDDRHWVAGDRGCDLFEFRGGRIVRKDSYWKIVEP